MGHEDDKCTSCSENRHPVSEGTPHKCACNDNFVEISNKCE